MFPCKAEQNKNNLKGAKLIVANRDSMKLINEQSIIPSQAKRAVKVVRVGDAGLQIESLIIRIVNFSWIWIPIDEIVSSIAILI